MSEIENGVEAPEAETSVTAEVETRNFETEAREMGWVPETDYKGPKEKWKPAQQFVEDGEKILPIVRSQLKKTQEQLAQRETEFQKRLERIEKINGESLRRAQEQHRQELERIRSEQRSAVEAGDVQEFDRLEKVRVNAEKSAPQVEEPVKPATDLAARQDAWRAENKWFDSDFDAQDFAIRYSDHHGRMNPNLTFEQNMAVVTTEVKKRFPHLFGAGKQTGGHSAVDGGGSFGAAPPRKDSIANQLPAEAMAQAKRDVANKLYPSVEAWAKVYLS